MSLVVIGDMHLGYERKSFSTKAARDRYKKAVFNKAKQSIQEGAKLGPVIMVGDLFDKANNDDNTLAQGISICNTKGLELVLAGNHDLVNKDKHSTTLSMVKEVVDVDIPTPLYNEYFFSENKYEGSKYTVYSVPYSYTQDLFLESLDKAKERAEELKKPCVLVLHTNYNLAFDKVDTTNNLEPDKAKELLSTFDFIFSGHEHNCSERLSGRLIMTGSVMPVSTSELETKYMFELTDEGVVKKHVIWDQAASKTYDVNDMPEQLPEGTEFVVVSGQSDRSTATAGMKTVVNWWKNCQSLLVCKPDWHVKESSVKKEATKSSGKSLDELIRALLTTDELVEAYDELLEEI